MRPEQKCSQRQSQRSATRLRDGVQSNGSYGAWFQYRMK